MRVNGRKISDDLRTILTSDDHGSAAPGLRLTDVPSRYIKACIVHSRAVPDDDDLPFLWPVNLGGLFMNPAAQTFLKRRSRCLLQFVRQRFQLRQLKAPSATPAVLRRFRQILALCARNV